MKKRIRSIPLGIIVFFAVVHVHAQSLLPPPSKEPDAQKKIATAKAAISEYKTALTSWSGRWDRVAEETPEFVEHLKKDLGIKPTRKSTTRQKIQVTCVKNQCNVQVTSLDKKGNIRSTYHASGTDLSVASIVAAKKLGVSTHASGTDLSIAYILDEIRDMVVARSVDFWDYCGEGNSFVSRSATVWSAAYLDPSKGYVPTKILLGNFKVDGASSLVFSDFKQDTRTGRWTPRQMVVTYLVPGQNVTGKIITLTCPELTLE